ncbi:hypothetical protein GCM10010250_21960 [Streptomyces althioticus]|uniref:hypothetical protein n=1 Tax=Streptomyces althioticus TaxID=83380 RepID=UPI0018736C61|nr:hypothetical protein GCM10010250_21960 [Streptomyces althioticus]
MTPQTEPMTAALSHATEVARQRVVEACDHFHRITLDYAAALLRETLPDAAAITIDSDDGELYEVRDADGKALYRAPFTPASPLTDQLADDVSDLFRQVLPLGGLAEAGWETAAEGEPYRSILLPTGTPRSTSTTPAAPAQTSGTPGEDAGTCAQCDRKLIWDNTGKGVNDEWGEYICYGPRRAGKAVHVLAK